MFEFKLVYPAKEYEEKAFDYIQEFLDYKSEIHGAGGLDRYDNYNEASAKVIMNNNGVLEKEVYSETYSQMIQRYWINL